MRVNRSKIEPPAIESSTIPRPRLELLISGLLRTHRVVVVTATAGAGKTTAVRQTLAGSERRSAWLSLQAADAQPGRLLTYLAAALSEVDIGLSEIVSSALTSGLSPAEAAELLGAAVPDLDRVLVIDNAEILGDHQEAIEVVTTFAQALPRSSALLISSRTSLPLTFTGPNALIRVGSLDESDLAFSVSEAKAALLLAGTDEVDAEEAVRLTGGWVAGVLFEAWRLDAHVAGLGGEADPLHGYLATEVLGRLDPGSRDFLILTSVLDHVTTELARGLKIADVAATMNSLRRVRLPAVWGLGGTSFRCHPRFREYLLELLERRPDVEVRAVRLAHARHLVRLGRWEDAVEVFIAADSVEEARRAAEEAIVDVVVRSDVEIAERWLGALADPVVEASSAFVEAELLLALAAENYGRGADICDRLLNTETGQQVLADSPRVVALTAWFYLHRGRLDAIHDVLRLGGIAPELDIVRYAIGLVEDDGADVWTPPALTGTPFDALAMRTHFDLGRLELLLEVEDLSPWAARAAAPWRLGALLATGRIDRCLELVQDLGRGGQRSAWVAEVVEPKLMAETGDVPGALSRLQAGRLQIKKSGSIYRLLASLLTEAELRLRHRTGLAEVPALFREVDRYEAGRSFANFREQHAMLTGLMSLLEGHDDLALPLLEESVNSMRRGRRVLWLPSAAVYLAEAKWRVGDPDGADEAASRALRGAAEQGTNHGLLQALSMFPDVVSRRLDAEPTSDSEWNRVGRSLATVTGSPVTGARGSLLLSEFGRLSVTMDGVETPLRLRKAFELLAVLADTGPEGVPRDKLLGFLFGNREERAASTYLRQAVMKLRQALPGVLPAASDGLLRLSDTVTAHTEFAEIASLRRQAASAREAARLSALMKAIEIAERGEYFPGCTSPWVVDRRSHLELQISELRADAAVVALDNGQATLAASLAESVLEADPFRESMWQVCMRAASAVGDHDSIVRIFRGCEAAMSSIGAKPSPTTVSLFTNFRR
jgi:DNA-binding SARP family transcriptional activator